MSTLVHSRGEGVKIGQNLVHVVVECPLRMLKVEITNEGHQRWQVVKAEGSETFPNIIHDDD